MTKQIFTDKLVAIDSLDTTIRIAIDRDSAGTPFPFPQLIDRDVTVEVGDVLRWRGLSAIVRSISNNIGVMRASWSEQESVESTEVKSVTPLITLEVAFTDDRTWNEREMLVVKRDFILEGMYPNDYYKPDKG